jgi:RNA polymerase sigma-70 factor (ECF subfamily)
MFNERMFNERPMEDPDAALVEALRSREATAFANLVMRYERRLLNMARAITKNREDAEDIVQEALLSVFTHLDSFRGDSRFSAWLTRITINRAWTTMRGRKRQFVSLDEHKGTEDSNSVGEIKAHGYTPEQLCAQQELAGIVRSLAAGVRASSRRVLELRLEGDLSEAEIAQVLQSTVPAVKSRLHRGKLDIRRSITAYLSSGSQRSPQFGAFTLTQLQQ